MDITTIREKSLFLPDKRHLFLNKSQVFSIKWHLSLHKERPGDLRQESRQEHDAQTSAKQHLHLPHYLDTTVRADRLKTLKLFSDFSIVRQMSGSFFGCFRYWG